MIMSMLYDINFIIGLLVTLLLTAIVSFYFTQRIEEQNEKISAMSMVVRAMADELSYFRNNMLINSQNEVKSVAPNAVPSASTNVVQSSNVGPVSTHVMQGGAQYNEDSKSYVIDLAKMGTTSDINLIQVSDCESEEEDSDSDSDSDSSSESGSDSGSESDSDSDDSDEDLDINELQELGDIKSDGENQVKSIKINLSNDVSNGDDLLDVEISEFTLGDTHLQDEATLSVDDIINSLTIAPEDAVKTINVSLDQETEKALMDYKKLPLDKLRAIVQEKKLCEDASKMKKKELFALLGV